MIYTAVTSRCDEMRKIGKIQQANNHLVLPIYDSTSRYLIYTIK
jgi:hypothetical protein